MSVITEQEQSTDTQPIPSTSTGPQTITDVSIKGFTREEILGVPTNKILARLARGPSPGILDALNIIDDEKLEALKKQVEEQKEKIPTIEEQGERLYHILKNAPESIPGFAEENPMLMQLIREVRLKSKSETLKDYYDFFMNWCVKCSVMRLFIKHSPNLETPPKGALCPPEIIDTCPHWCMLRTNARRLVALEVFAQFPESKEETPNAPPLPRFTERTAPSDPAPASFNTTNPPELPSGHSGEGSSPPSPTETPANHN